VLCANALWEYLLRLAPIALTACCSTRQNIPTLRGKVTRVQNGGTQARHKRRSFLSNFTQSILHSVNEKLVRFVGFNATAIYD